MEDFNGVLEVKVPDYRQESERIAEVVHDLGLALGKLASNIWAAIEELTSDIMEALSTIFNKITEDELLRREALELGLVSPRVISLCGHKRSKVAKKNMSRVRKEVKRARGR